MALRPNKPMFWATEPPDGYPGAVEPNEARKHAGWKNRQRPPAGHFNWLFKHVGDWIQYFDAALWRLATRNWNAVELRNTNGPLDAGVGMFAAAYKAPSAPGSPSKWVAVGGDSLIVGSSDGQFWLEETPDSYDFQFNDVCAGNFLFVAVGVNGEIQTSPFDGVWTHRANDGAFAGWFRGVCWFPNGQGASSGVFVAVGDDGEIQTSTVGHSLWTHRNPDAGYNGDFYSVAANESIAVAVGANGEIQTSSDGTTWTHRTADGAYAGTFLQVIWVDALGMFVAVGSAGEIQTSPDGITWTRRRTGGFDIITVAYGLHGLIAFAFEGLMYESFDAVTWSTGIAVERNVRRVVFGGGRFIFCGGVAGGAFVGTGMRFE